jgi:hypothetical protein
VAGEGLVQRTAWGGPSEVFGIHVAAPGVRARHGVQATRVSVITIPRDYVAPIAGLCVGRPLWPRLRQVWFFCRRPVFVDLRRCLPEELDAGRAWV